jgi:hypothetical protein
MSSDLSAEITAMATVALVLVAIATAAIALGTYVLSGSRIRVDTRYGMPMNGGRPSKPERGNGLVSRWSVAEDALDDGGVLG